MVVGDWGGQDDPPYYTDPEKDMHHSHTDGRDCCQPHDGSSVSLSIYMGDNFYDNGVTDVDDPRFKETFEVATRCKRHETQAIILATGYP